MPGACSEGVRPRKRKAEGRKAELRGAKLRRPFLNMSLCSVTDEGETLRQLYPTSQKVSWFCNFVARGAEGADARNNLQIIILARFLLDARGGETAILPRNVKGETQGVLSR
jgi:hypothetical protein